MSILPNCHSEEATRFACAQAGYPECMHFLLQRHEGLVHACIRHAEIGGVAYADVAQEGRIGLWRAILRYDPSRQVAFSTFAWRRILGQIWRKSLAYRQNGESLEEEPFECCVAQIAEEAWQQEQICRALREGLETLPLRLRGILEQHYGLNGQPPLSLAAIGRQMGLSRERIRQLRNEALGLLRLPAFSLRLRSLYEQDSRWAYRQARRGYDAQRRRRRAGR